MSQYYTANRQKNLFNPKSKTPFKLSRSKIELFMNCPRCFYLDRRLGVGQPGGFPFNLNKAVDTLLKKEFDSHRVKGEAHPLMKKYGIKAVPFAHDMMDEWRENFKGMQYLHEPTNLIITGAVDDIWINSKKELMVVDYKATSKETEVNLDSDWQIGYKRQMEMYQWLFRQAGFKVSSLGYFVYVNGRTDRAAFDAKLEFDIKIIPYKGDDGWVEQAVIKAHKCLMADVIPASASGCDFCSYRHAARAVEKV